MSRALGLDFGTTNTVLALTDPGQQSTHSMQFESSAGVSDSMRTALSFMKDATLGAQALKVEAGQAAIRMFIDNPGDCRFLQSIKTFAASAAFQATVVFARKQQFEDLMEIFLRRLKAYAGDHWPSDISRLVVGRPVHFAGSNPDEKLALERYQAALTRFELPEIHYVYEPVAAAYYFAPDAGPGCQRIGGRFWRRHHRLFTDPFRAQCRTAEGNPDRPFRCRDRWRPFRFPHDRQSRLPGNRQGQPLQEFRQVAGGPFWLLRQFRSLEPAVDLKTTREFADLQSLVRSATEPDKLELFIELIEHDEGYPLYQAISATKMALSMQEEAEFNFSPLGKAGRKIVKRADFEGWIADDLARIEGALDEVLTKTNTAPQDVDKVFLTGGTSFVPAVRRIFERRFDAGRIESGGELLSIAHGLALIGDSGDVARWAA